MVEFSCVRVQQICNPRTELPFQSPGATSAFTGLRAFKKSQNSRRGTLHKPSASEGFQVTGTWSVNEAFTEKSPRAAANDEMKANIFLMSGNALIFKAFKNGFG